MGGGVIPQPCGGPVLIGPDILFNPQPLDRFAQCAKLKDRMVTFEAVYTLADYASGQSVGTIWVIFISVAYDTGETDYITYSAETDIKTFINQAYANFLAMRSPTRFFMPLSNQVLLPNQYPPAVFP